MNKRNIVVVTNGNYFARLILERLLLERTSEVVGIALIEGDYSGRTELRALWYVGRRTAFPYTAYKVIQWLVFHLAQKRHRHVWFEVKAMARDLQIPMICAPKVNSPEVFEWLCEKSPALGVSVSCPQRIRTKVLNLPELGFLNVHCSLLPEYAGLAPYFWVLAENQSQTGVTIHRMTEEFDAGNILVQYSLPIPPSVSAFVLFRELSFLGAEALIKAIDLALEGEPGVPQDLSRRSYRSHPSYEAYRALRPNNFVLARWCELYQAVHETIQQQARIKDYLARQVK